MRWALVIGLGMLVMAGRLSVADPLPIKHQALLLLRILAYDHKLTSRVDGKKITIYVVHKNGAAESEDPANEMITALREIAKSTTQTANALTGTTRRGK